MDDAAVNDERTTPEGVPIVAMAAIVNRTGDGLSKAIDVQPIVIEAGGECYIAMRVRKTKDHYLYTDPADGEVVATHVQVFTALNSAIVDSKTVARALRVMAGKVAKAESDRKGQLTLVVDEQDDDEDDAEDE
jgi:hypothetical protein